MNTQQEELIKSAAPEIIGIGFLSLLSGFLLAVAIFTEWMTLIFLMIPAAAMLLYARSAVKEKILTPRQVAKIALMALAVGFLAGSDLNGMGL